RAISRQPSGSYQERSTDVAVLAAELGVRYVLEGNMRTHGDKLRVNVELIDPKTRLPAWSARIERAGTDRHAIHDEILGRLGRELMFEVVQVESNRSSPKSGADELIFKGWAAMFLSNTTGIGALKQAEAYFTQALELDPLNRAARTGLAAYHSHVATLLLDADPQSHLAK